MKNNSLPASLILGLCIGLGVALAGLFVAQAMYATKAAERFVTVKGLAERGVKADLAIWPLTFNRVGNDLVKLQASLDKDRELIRAFLIAQGFNPQELSDSPPKITDFYAQGYNNRNLPPNRYKAEASVTLTSNNIGLVKKTMEQAGKLVSQGVVLAHRYGSSADFLFTGLNKIKPAMIAEATKNARAAAEQFARDSGSQVGSIRRAQQGLFSIRNRDPNSPDLKIVRVVSTVQFFLQQD